MNTNISSSGSTRARWTTLATTTVVVLGVALSSGGSPAGAATKRTTKKVTPTTLAKPRAPRLDDKPATRTATTLPSTAALTTEETVLPPVPEIEKSESSTTSPGTSLPTGTEPPRAQPSEPKRTEPPRTEPPRTLPTVPQPTNPPRTEPARTEPPRTLPTVPQPTLPSSTVPAPQTPSSQPSTEIRTLATLEMRCAVVERNVRCEWSGDAQGGVRYLLLRGHAGDAAGRVIGPFDTSTHTAADIAPPSKLTFSYLLVAQNAAGKNTAHSSPVSVTIP